MVRSRIVAFSLILATGCQPIALPYLKDDNPRDATAALQSPESAERYCRRISRAADLSAQRSLGLGIVTTLLAAGSLAVGAVVGPDPAADANWAQRNRNALILGAGGLLAIPATILLMRSKDASATSAATGKVMFDNDAMLKCLAARADLVGARSALADFARKDLDGRLKVLDGLHNQVKADLETARDETKRTKSDATEARVKVLERMEQLIKDMKLQVYEK